MKNLLSNLSTRCNQVMFHTIEAMNKHKKALSFAYVLAFLTSLFPTLAMASNNFEMWQATQGVLDIIFTILIVVGVIVTLIGVVLIFIARFNEQSITGPLITAAVGIGLICIRILAGTLVSKIAFEQMYPGHKWSEWKDLEKTLNP